MSTPGLITLAIAAAALLAGPSHATQPSHRIAARPCPDLSRILPYGRTHGIAAPDGAGGAFVVWNDDREVVIQRCRENGRPAAGWPADGLGLGAASPDGSQAFVESDGEGGALVAWIGRRGEVRVQRVRPSCGIAPGWPAAGLLLCDLEGTGRHPMVTLTEDDAAAVVWREQETDGEQSIRMSRVTFDGGVDPRWPARGLVLERGADLGQLPNVVAAGRGDAFVSWRRPGDEPYEGRVVVERVTAGGKIVRGEPAKTVRVLHPEPTAEEDRDAHLLVPGWAGQAFLVWCEMRSLDDAARGLEVGALRFGSGHALGGSMAFGPGDQHLADAAPDGRGGVLIAWFDDATTTVVVGSMDAGGTRRVLGSFAAAGAERLAIAPDGRDGAWVAWTGGDGMPHLVRAGHGPAREAAIAGAAPGGDPTRLGLVVGSGGTPMLVWAAPEGDAWRVRIGVPQ